MNIFVHWINEDGGKGTLSLIHLLYCCRCRGGGGGGGGGGGMATISMSTLSPIKALRP